MQNKIANTFICMVPYAWEKSPCSALLEGRRSTVRDFDMYIHDFKMTLWFPTGFQTPQFQLRALKW